MTRSSQDTNAYQANGGFQTSTGTLYVSKPYRSKASKKLRALITFTPRKSVFDINNEDTTSNEFRVSLIRCYSHTTQSHSNRPYCRASSHSSGYQYSYSAFRHMCAVSRPAVDHSTYNSRPCSLKMPSHLHGATLFLS